LIEIPEEFIGAIKTTLSIAYDMRAPVPMIGKRDNSGSWKGWRR
jgi:hypothetical protein